MTAVVNVTIKMSPIQMLLFQLREWIPDVAADSERDEALHHEWEAAE